MSSKGSKGFFFSPCFKFTQLPFLLPHGCTEPQVPTTWKQRRLKLLWLLPQCGETATRPPGWPQVRLHTLIFWLPRDKIIILSLFFIELLFRLLHRSVLPEPPVVKLMEVKDNTFSLVWTPGLEGDSPITGFILEYKAVNGKTFISASTSETFILNRFSFLFPHSLLGFYKDSCRVWP